MKIHELTYIFSEINLRMIEVMLKKVSDRIFISIQEKTMKLF